MVSWFAGLFYIVRLFVYHTEAKARPELERKVLHDQFSIMEWRLWYIITTPAMYLTVLFGTIMLFANSALIKAPWMHVKLTFVFVLLIYHFICQRLMNQLKSGTSKWTTNHLRLWNEFSTLILVAVVFLAVQKNELNWIGGVLGFFGVGIALMIGIKAYKKWRKN